MKSTFGLFVLLTFIAVLMMFIPSNSAVAVVNMNEDVFVGLSDEKMQIIYNYDD